MKLIKPTLVLFAMATFAGAFAEVKSADAMMTEAFKIAKAEKKTVFLSFHASWCGWCHKLEGFINRQDIKPIWNKRFVTVWLTVQESPEKKADENPGGLDWMKKVGGENAGLPFIALFDGDGTLKANSDRPADKAIKGDKGGNTGYPAAKEEVAWFITMIRKAAPNVTQAERKIIESALIEEGKKLGH